MNTAPPSPGRMTPTPNPLERPHGASPVVDAPSGRSFETWLLTYHTQSHIAGPDGREAEVDAALVPLVAALWRAGYDTAASCQDWGAAYREMPAHTVGMAGVGFDSERDLRRFQNVVGASGSTIRTSDEDRAVAVEGRASVGIVLFPASDITAVTRRVSAAARNSA
jgi:hypothetical protein